MADVPRRDAVGGFIVDANGKRLDSSLFDNSELVETIDQVENKKLGEEMRSRVMAEMDKRVAKE